MHLILVVLCCQITLIGQESIDKNSRRYMFLESGIRQLFLDGFNLGALYRVKRKIHQPHKYEGNPVIRADQPWKKTPGQYAAPGKKAAQTEMIQATSAPIWDPEEKVWKMWYGSRGGTGFARSRDGIVWEKPNLEKKEFQGSRKNNLVAVKGNPEGSVQHVIWDPIASKEERYKGLLGARGRKPLVSADGYQFTVLDVPPIPSQDTSQLTFDEMGKQYILTVKHRGSFGRSVFLSLSKDFRTWSEPELIFHADALDQQLGAERIREHMVNPNLYTPLFNEPSQYNTEIYKMPIFPYEGIYIGFPNYFESSGITPPHHNNQDGVNSAKLSTSRDLHNWVKVGNRDVFLPVSELGGGVIDTAQVLPLSRPIPKGDELWIYYSGLDVRYPAKGAYKGAIHLARLRRDGFVSFWADERGGFAETRAVRFEGNRLFVNADASRGELRAEVIDERGRKVLTGWSRDLSQAIDSDQLRVELSWQRQKGIQDLKGKNVRFRFHLKETHLFSFWIEPS